jgi:hypothetical protein
MSKSKFYFIATGEVLKIRKKYEFKKEFEKFVNRHALKILKIMKLFKKDVWFATKILGWDFEPSLTGFQHVGKGAVVPIGCYHFHRKNGSVVRVGDY